MQSVRLFPPDTPVANCSRVQAHPTELGCRLGAAQPNLTQV